MPPAQTKKGIYPMKKEITVQELINQLNQIENKNIPVDIVLLDDGIGPLKKGEHTRFEKLVFNTSKPSGKVVSVSLGVDGMEKYVREEFDDFVSVADKPECQAEIEEWTQLFRGDRQFAIDMLDYHNRCAWSRACANAKPEDFLEPDEKMPNKEVK